MPLGLAIDHRIDSRVIMKAQNPRKTSVFRLNRIIQTTLHFIEALALGARRNLRSVQFLPASVYRQFDNRTRLQLASALVGRDYNVSGFNR